MGHAHQRLALRCPARLYVRPSLSRPDYGPSSLTAVDEQPLGHMDRLSSRSPRSSAFVSHEALRRSMGARRGKGHVRLCRRRIGPELCQTQRHQQRTGRAWTRSGRMGRATLSRSRVRVWLVSVCCHSASRAALMLEADLSRFVNPPSLQSIRSLGHFHVLARRK